jgi:hypothetical protein
VVAYVPTPNERHKLSCVPCLALRYRLFPATFPRCQNCAKDVAGVTFTTHDYDEVDESGISEIDNGMNESNNPSNTNDIIVNTDHNDDDDDDLGDEDDILDEEGDDTTKSSATTNRGRLAGKCVVSIKRVALSLQEKVDIIKYYDSTKYSTSKPISLRQLGIWAQKRFRYDFLLRTYELVYVFVFCYTPYFHIVE